MSRPFNRSAIIGHGMQTRLDGKWAGIKLHDARRKGEAAPTDVHELLAAVKRDCPPEVLEGIGDGWFAAELWALRMKCPVGSPGIWPG